MIMEHGQRDRLKGGGAGGVTCTGGEMMPLPVDVRQIFFK